MPKVNRPRVRVGTPKRVLLPSWGGASHRVGRCCLSGSGSDKPRMAHSKLAVHSRPFRAQIAKLAKDIATMPYRLTL